MDFPPQPISSSASTRRFFQPPPRTFHPPPPRFREQARHQIVTMIIGQDTPVGYVADDVAVECGRLSRPH